MMYTRYMETVNCINQDEQDRNSFHPTGAYLLGHFYDVKTAE